MEFPIATLAKIINSEPVEQAGVFTGVSIDSRTIKHGECFFAIAGDNFDGHDYVAEAFAKGGTCAVVSKATSGDNLLKVDDTTEALGSLAHQYRRQMDCKVIAITGSVGKTTTRQIVYEVLSRHFRTVQSPKNFNNAIGVPLTIFGAGDEDEIIITELGANKPGEIAYLSRIAQPDIAVVTNVHPAHLEGFGDLQTIIQEKLSISRGLQPDGVFIINGDFDQLVDACHAKGTAFTTFGKSAKADASKSGRNEAPSGELRPEKAKIAQVQKGPQRRREKEHLDFVSSQNCMVCGRFPSQAHHIRYAQPRALGRKVSDEWTVPLCAIHHRALHDAGVTPKSGPSLLRDLAHSDL